MQALLNTGGALYVGGLFVDAAGLPVADYLAVALLPGPWSGLGNAFGDGPLGGAVNAIAVSGPDVYVGGFFVDLAGNPAADYVARWNGMAWSALGSNGAGNGALNSTVYALALSGTNLYVGGGFTDAANIPTADHLARWSGTAWSALGSDGAGNGALTSSVQALAVTGSNVYAGGTFLNAANIATADLVARWNGSAWSGLGSNGAGNGALSGFVAALVMWGTDVYVGVLPECREYPDRRQPRPLERQRVVRGGLRRRGQRCHHGRRLRAGRGRRKHVRRR